MALHDTLAIEAIDFVVALLLPLILPACPDPQAARALALRLLAAHTPENERDLQLAGEAVAFSIRAMGALAEAADPALPPERRDAASRRAGSLSRSGLQVQRCVAALQRERRAARRAPPPFTVAPLREDPLAGTPMTAPPAEAPHASPPPARVQPRPEADASPVPDMAQAEAQLRRAEKLLALMLAHHNGAPPPNSKAAQDIEAQKRAVDAARIALRQAAIRADQAAAEVQGRAAR